ncbi:MAG: lipoprotein signal peptidase [Flavobacterium sp.]|nr:lipoprotein signal peptidase [Flavobacterium sp.]
MKKALILVFAILLLDQALKFYIKTTMYLGQEYNVLGDWFIIHFTENEGMAFGWKFAGEYGKLFLSLFRIAAITAIFWYLYKIIRQKEDKILILSVSFILAGAIGNIIDSAFYGLIFNESGDYFNPGLAVLFPEGGGYATFLHGKVVDMFYFPIIKGTYPDWSPFNAGYEFIFFRPVFNIADASISVGVIILILFQKRIFKQKEVLVEEIEQSETKLADGLA